MTVKMDDLSKELKEKENVKSVILPVMYSYKDKREKVFENYPKEELREKLRKIKEYSILNISELKKKAVGNFEKNGIHVIEAKSSKEAVEKIREIIGKEKLIIKSKSNTANEIGLKDALKDKELVETDTGDFLVQISSERDIHPVLPALHLTPEKISETIRKKFGGHVKPEKEAIVAFVRQHLRKKIEGAKVWITGANALTADGSIVILENEGNISLVSRIPDKHIVISSFDKIVPTIEDAIHVARCAAVYGTGQEFPVYVSVISGPSKTADIQNELVTGAQGAKELYLVLVDNGRSEILNSEFKELLYCINCGACLNFCPVYHNLSDRYGSKYSGAKGVLFSLFDEGLKESYENGAFFCTMCRNCSENCPSEIDLPEMMKKLRGKLAEKGIEPPDIREMLSNIEKFGNPFGEAGKDGMPKNLYCC
ncbi:MAG: LUD domain-containing protein [Candidatus Woesearchaeota archaeon]|nr:LUD domain-containing protein [Candidatus Woesearchaeota archaeon]